MADRQLKIVVRTEIKKGFADLTKQMQQLNASMKQLGALSGSINRLADSFEGVARGAKAASAATKSIGASTQGATALVNKFATAQEKLIANAATLQRAGASSSKARAQALTTETRLLQDYIKKTGDLSVLEKRRDAKGRFGYGGLSSAAVNTVKAQVKEISKPVVVPVKFNVTPPKIDNTVQSRINKMLGIGTGISYSKTDKSQLSSFYRGLFDDIDANGTKIITKMNNQAAAIKLAMSRLVSPSEGLSEKSKKAMRAARYADLEAAFNAPKYGPPLPKNFNTVPGTSGMGGGNNGGSGITIPRLGPRPSDSAAVEKLMNAYTRLGHVIFQLQYSTLTLFGATGIGMIIKQADAYISLRNTVAQTSMSVQELGQNMKDVFKISKETFTDPQANGKIFSLLERYSGATGQTRDQVSSTTQAIAAAFSASPGTKESKSAAQYQFVQGIQSNRFGGDELRSVLEGAPLVGQLLSKYIAKDRGMPEGSMIDLRAQKGLKAKEVIKAASDPAFLKEAMGILQNRTRTFGDVMQLAQLRMLEYTGKAQEATGLFGVINQTLAKFLGNDVVFGNFIKSIQFAALALATLGTIALARAAPGLVGKALGPGITGGLKKAGGASLADLTGATARNAFIGPMPSRGIVFANAGRAAGQAVGGVGRGVAGFAGEALAGGPLGLAGASLSKILPLFAQLGKFLFSMGGVVTIVVTVLALLVARFNSLLGDAKTGISIFTILQVWFKRLFKVMSDLPGADIVIGIFRAVGNAIDWLLGKAANMALQDREIQAQAIDNGYMGKVAKNDKGGAIVSAFTRQFQIKDDNGQFVGYSDGKKDKEGRLILNDEKGKGLGRSLLKAGETGFTGKERADLPDTPKSGGASKAKQLADRIAEFFRDLKLQAADITDTINNSASYLEIEKPVKDAEKKLLDIYNIDLDKFNGDLGRAIDSLPAGIKEQLNKSTAALRAANIAKSIDDFVNSIRTEFIDKMMGAVSGGMSAKAGGDLSFEMGKIKELIGKGGMFSTDKSKQDAVLEAMRNGNYDRARELYNADATDTGRTSLTGAVSENAKVNGRATSLASNYNSQVFEAQVDLQRQVNRFYGERRELAQQLADIESRYIALQDKNGELTKEEIAAKDRELEQAKELYDIDQRRQSNTVAGLKSAVAAYYDSITDLATQTQNIFANVFTGIEDGIVSAIMNTEKYDWRALGRDILTQITKSFVQTKIMKPLLGKLFSGTLESPQYDSIRAKSLIIDGAIQSGGSGLGAGISELGVTGSPRGLLDWGIGAIKNIFDSGKPASSDGSKAGGGWANFLAKAGSQVLTNIFHGGGVAGDSNASTRMVNPSVFRNAKYYHTGGIAGMPGLHSNEVPAILQRGERILSNSQQANMGSGGGSSNVNQFSPNVTVNYTSSGKGGTEEDAKVIANAVDRQIEVKLNQFALKQKKDGGIF